MMVRSLRGEYRLPSLGQCQSECRNAVRWLGASTSLLSSAQLLGTLLALSFRIGNRVPQRRAASDPATLDDHTLRDIGLDRMHLRYGHSRGSFQNDL